MPRRKSATSLEKLCLEIVHQNLDTLKNAAKDLPSYLINVLHKKSVDHYVRLVEELIDTPPPPPLPTDLFFHSGTKAISTLHYYDQVPHRIVDLINRLCKNVESVYLTEHLYYVNLITVNNPHILRMDLHSPKCKDVHLKIIGRNCPQLQSLKLWGCLSITDNGTNHLPEKLVDLHLPHTPNISIAGQLNALQRLPHLKKLFTPIHWHNMIEIIAESPDNRFNDRKFEIEEIFVSLDTPLSNNFLRVIGTLFPKLRSLECVYSLPRNDSNFIATVEAINHNFLTRLTVCGSSECIRIVAQACPMLEEFEIRTVKISSDGCLNTLSKYIRKLSKCIEKNSDLYLATSEHIPFKYLRKLTVHDSHNLLALDDFFYLMVNCRLLSHLSIKSFTRFTNQVMFDILRDNPLKCLETIYFSNCGAFSGEALCELLKSLSSLRCFEIYSHGLLDEDKIKVQTLIEEMNWEMKLITWN